MEDAEFIAHARTDVEVLAKSLKIACETIREAANALNGYHDKITDPYSKKLLELADELEAMPEQK